MKLQKKKKLKFTWVPHPQTEKITNFLIIVDQFGDYPMNLNQSVTWTISSLESLDL